MKEEDDRYKQISERIKNMEKNILDMDEKCENQQKRMEYVKCCIHVKNNVPLDLISMNWTLKHVSVNGQIVVKTCQCGGLKSSKYQDIETDVEDQMGKWQSKNSLQRL